MIALLLAAFWPGLLAIMLIMRPLARAARALAPWAALPALVIAFLPREPGEALHIPWLLLGARVGIDAATAVLLPAAAGLWLACGLFARPYLAADPRRDAFDGWFLAAQCGNLILLVALDAALFYLGFALMSFAAYGLVVHDGGERARFAGRVYLVMVVAGELCLFGALAVALELAGGVDFTALRAAVAAHPDGGGVVVGLTLAGFGIKAGLLGLHVWLPLAHPVAPSPASAVLSGAMIKAGLLGWLRLLPIGEAAFPGWGALLACAGLATALYAVAVGVCQREPKTVLAYSSVSQMGVMAFGVALALNAPGRPEIVAAVVVYALHHGLAKGALFLGAGVTARPLPSGWPVVVTAAGLVLGAVTLAGAPATGGLVAKLALKEAAHAAPALWDGQLVAWLGVSAVATAVLMLRFLYLAWPRPAQPAAVPAAGLLLPWLSLLAAAWIAPWLAVGGSLRRAAVVAAAAGSWPLLVAVAIALAAMRLPRRWRLPAIPPGDVVLPAARWLGLACANLLRGCARLARLRDALQAELPALLPGAASAEALRRGEQGLLAWRVTGFLVVLAGVLVSWLSI